MRLEKYEIKWRVCKYFAASVEYGKLLVYQNYRCKFIGSNLFISYRYNAYIHISIYFQGALTSLQDHNNMPLA